MNLTCLSSHLWHIFSTIYVLGWCTLVNIKHTVPLYSTASSISALPYIFSWPWVPHITSLSKTIFCWKIYEYWSYQYSIDIWINFCININVYIDIDSNIGSPILILMWFCSQCQYWYQYLTEYRGQCSFQFLFQNPPCLKKNFLFEKLKCEMLDKAGFAQFDIRHMAH